MKRLLITIAAVLLASICVNAQRVTEEQALQKAHAFMQSKVAAATGSRHNAPRKMRKLAKAAENDAYYVFNAEDNGGFVIVSGDERTEAILGYSTEGSIAPQNMPENMKAWLKGYEEQIKAIPAEAKVVANEVATHPVIAPMLTTRWGQQSPYNLQCPTVNGQQCVTGCVATALAQIMNYHKWPQGSTTAIPAYSEFEELPPTKFDWNQMKNTYVSSATGTQADAVAKLMQYCGRAFQMDYGIEESGTNFSFFKSLTEYFGYSDKARLVRHTAFSAAEWDALIYHEIESGRPVLYAGDGSEKLLFGGAHAFVVDGYDGSGYYHMNFGWNGYTNGYYRLSIMPPIVFFGSGGTIGSYGDDFWKDLQAVIGIQRPGDNEEDPLGGIIIRADISCNSDASTLTAKYANVGHDGEHFDLGIRYISIDANTIDHIIISDYFIPVGYTFTESSIQPSGLADGYYKAVAIWKHTSESTWHEDGRMTANLDISNNGTSIVVHPSEESHLAVGEIEFLGNLVAPDNIIFQFSLSNQGADFMQYIYTKISNLTTLEDEGPFGRYVALGEGETVTIAGGFFCGEAGDYKVVISADPSGDNILTEKTVTISNAFNILPVGTPKYYDWDTQTFVFTVENNDTKAYTKEIKVRFSIPGEEDTESKIFSSGKLNIAPGETKTILIDCKGAKLGLSDLAQVVWCRNTDRDIYDFDRSTAQVSLCTLTSQKGDLEKLTIIAGDDVYFYTIYDKVNHCAYIESARSSSDILVLPSQITNEEGVVYKVTAIGQGSIFECKEIRNLIMSEGITSISSPFTPIDNFEKLETITFPASMQYIDYKSVGYCPNLCAIYSKNPVPPTIVCEPVFADGMRNKGFFSYEDFFVDDDGNWITRTVETNYDSITLYVPIGSRDAYAKAWSAFINIVEMDVNDMPSSFISGDANGDGEVNVSDIVEIVNYIMGKPSANLVLAAADLNGDGEINVTDIVKMISIIMSANSNDALVRAYVTDMTDNDRVYLNVEDDNVFSLCLDNDEQYVASQFDLRLTEGQKLDSISLNGNRSDGHMITYTKTGDNLYKVLVYSLTNEAFAGNCGQLIDFMLTGIGNVSIENIIFVTAGHQEKRFAPLGSGTTGIGCTEELRVKSEKLATSQWYTLDGRKLNKQSSKKGIYINKGKKLVIK